MTLESRDSTNKPQRHEMVGGFKCTRSHRVSRPGPWAARGVCAYVAFSPSKDERLGGHAGAPGGAPPKVAMHSPYSIFAPPVGSQDTHGTDTVTDHTDDEPLTTQRNADSQTHTATGPGHDPGRRPGANPAADSVSEEATPANPTLVTLPPPTPRAHLPGVTTVGIKIRWHQPCAAVDSACAQALVRGEVAHLDLSPERAL
jgi:hypothetical protein